MYNEESLNRTSGTRRASEIELQAKQQEKQLALLRACYRDKSEPIKESSSWKKTALKLRTLFVSAIFG